MRRLFGCLGLVAVLCMTQSAMAQQTRKPTPPPSLWLEELTWIEVRDAISDGYTNIIIPSAGIEQNGIHLPLNKSQLIVRNTATHIAETLGNTLIAPVVNLVPEGDVRIKSGHMAYAGTISIPRKVFADVLEYSARSLYRHGFQQVFFIGDSEGNQLAQEMIAKSLQNEKKAAYHIASYYADMAQLRTLAEQGYTRATVGGHGGLTDTSETMAVAPQTVRRYRLEDIPESAFSARGAWGRNTEASAELGRAMLKIKEHAAVQEICDKAKAKPRGCRRR